MLFLFLLRGRDGFKGLCFQGNPLEPCYAAILAGNRWGASGLCRECAWDLNTIEQPVAPSLHTEDMHSEVRGSSGERGMEEDRGN